MNKTPSFWTKLPVIICMAFISCFLWGSAFPCIKTGYRFFSIASDDAASQLLFAGYRFMLAGLLVIVVGSLVRKRLLLPARGSLLPILIVSLFQTIGQYFFFYIGTANTSGVNASIIVASSTFFSILVSALIFRYEKLTNRKILGCIIGFIGILLIQIPGGVQMHFSFIGEGFVLFSTLMYAVAASFMKRFSGNEDPLTISGWQFFIGGVVLTIAGAAAGGKVTGFTPVSVLLLFYMAVISAGAFSLWSMLLKHNPISRIAVFQFMNPVIGVILSALILGEQNQAFTVYGLGSLVLVSVGIIIVNYGFNTKKQAA